MPKTTCNDCVTQGIDPPEMRYSYYTYCRKHYADRQKQYRLSRLKVTDPEEYKRTLLNDPPEKWGLPRNKWVELVVELRPPDTRPTHPSELSPEDYQLWKDLNTFPGS